MEVVNSDQEGLWSGNHESVVKKDLEEFEIENFFIKDIEMFS